jgi:hypothetical protein
VFLKKRVPGENASREPFILNKKAIIQNRKNYNALNISQKSNQLLKTLLKLSNMPVSFF